MSLLYAKLYLILKNVTDQTLSFVTDPTTGSAKTQTDPHAPTELILSALTVEIFSAVLDLTIWFIYVYGTQR